MIYLIKKSHCLMSPPIAILLCFISMPGFCISLFNKSAYHAFIADKKANMAGDLITVLIIETANAQTKSEISSNKNLSTSLTNLLPHHPLDSTLHLKGDGRIHAQTERTGTIKATVTIPIKAIISEGLYYIKGSQDLQINGETQTIELEAVARAEDISAQNTILSTRLSNAHIIYKGYGDVSNAHTHHYVYRLLSAIGLI